MAEDREALLRAPVVNDVREQIGVAAVRDAIGLTGSKEGCDDSECGACMMLLDGQPVNSCSYLALQAEGWKRLR